MKINDVEVGKYYIMMSDERRGSQLVIPKGAIVEVRFKNINDDSVDVIQIKPSTMYYKVAMTVKAKKLCDPDLILEPLTHCEPFTDTGNYDAHYAAMPIQPLEVMQGILSHQELIGFLKGNIIKYAMRAGHKQGESAAKDATKAKRYVELLSQVEQQGCIAVNKNKEDK